MRFNANEGIVPFMTLERSVSLSESAESLLDADDMLYNAIENGSDERIHEVVAEITGTDCLSNHRIQTVTTDSQRHSARHSVHTGASSRNSDCSIRTHRKGRNKGEHSVICNEYYLDHLV